MENIYHKLCMPHHLPPVCVWVVEIGNYIQIIFECHACLTRLSWFSFSCVLKNVLIPPYKLMQVFQLCSCWLCTWSVMASNWPLPRNLCLGWTIARTFNGSFKERLARSHWCSFNHWLKRCLVCYNYYRYYSDGHYCWILGTAFTVGLSHVCVCVRCETLPLLWMFIVLLILNHVAAL